MTLGMVASLEWLSLPPTPRFAGVAEQPRPPAPTMVEWPPPPARGSAPPPPPSYLEESSEADEID